MTGATRSVARVPGRNAKFYGFNARDAMSDGGQIISAMREEGSFLVNAIFARAAGRGASLISDAAGLLLG